MNNNLAQHFHRPFTQGPPRGGEAFHIIGALVFLVLMVVGIVLLVKLLNHSQKSDGSYRDPLDIAKERYAKGEITKVELAEIKKELK